jgi:membrane protein YdbS with pleckstrin-like domain
MNAKAIVGCAVLVLVLIPAVAMIPDLVRYMKIRAM